MKQQQDPELTGKIAKTAHEIDDAIAAIQKAAANRKRNPSWGHLGDLNYAKEQLVNVAKFLNGEDF